MQLLEAVGPANPSIALAFPGVSLTYGELHARAVALARGMGSARQLVALEARHSEHFVIAWLACLMGGHVAALLPPDCKPALDAFVEDFDPGLVFAQMNGRWRMERREATPVPLHDDLAVLLATSGSEGKAKWVRLSRANLDANAASIAEYLKLTPADRAAVTLPFQYSYGLSVLNSHLLAGASLGFAGASVAEAGWMERAAALGCTGVPGVPFSYELFERIGLRENAWPALRYMTVAGGRLAPEMVRAYHRFMAARGAEFFVMYGQTEATARIAYLPPELAETHADCIGVAVPGGRLRVDGGELVYSGPNVMMGYAVARADLARGSELSELRTGDLAVEEAPGMFRITGRARRMSKIAGLRINHEAVEWALRALGLDAAVTGDDERLVACCAGPCREQNVCEAMMKASGLPAHCLRVAKVDALPRTASGKIDHAALRVYLRDGARESLLEEFRNIFYPRPVAADDSFDGLGGDSLAFVQASLALERHLGHLPKGWERMSLRALEAVPARAAKTVGVEPHLAIRAAAILMIVTHHATLWPIPGGAATLMLLVGYGFARFQSYTLFEGRLGSFLSPLIRNLAPYFAILAGFTAAWGALPWASLLLIGNLGFATPEAKTMLPYQFWFVEAYAQLCLIVAGLFALKPVRGYAKAEPFAAGMMFLAAAVAARFAVPLIHDIGGRQIFFPSWVLYLPAFGWCAFHAGTARRKLMLMLAGAAVFPLAAYAGGNWVGSWLIYMLQLALVAALMGWKRLALPRAAAGPILTIAAASYHIYLFHRIIPEALGLERGGPAVMIAAGLAIGLGAYWLQHQMIRRLKNMRLAPVAA